ncbi:MAG: pyridoxal phosphate-dependent aminotransferase [Chloroflexi bacterium]|nr:pyridoxal phosphate-dependent aminotransferase [Chloroflexota bacterium]
MHFDFDAVVERRGTCSTKWDKVEERFGVPGALPMWVADMDFRSPPQVVEAVQRAAEHGIFGYACITDSYYEAATEWMNTRHRWKVRPEWLVYSPGVIPALNVIIREFSEPGDEIIVQPPVYYPFFHAIERNGRRILENPLTTEKARYTMDLADLESKINSRTKIILLCSPHNPVGRVWLPDELRALGEMCLRHGILVVSDEIHHDLVFRGYQHTPYATISDELAANCIVCTGATKTFNLAGLHSSNIIIPSATIRQRFKEAMLRSGCGSPNLFGIIATEAGYRHGAGWLNELMEYLEGNFQLVQGFAAERLPGMRVTRPEGTYLLWLDLRDTRIPREMLANFICRDAGVAVQSGRVFGAGEDGFERMNIGCPRATLQQALNRIEEAYSRLSF